MVIITKNLYLRIIILTSVINIFCAHVYSTVDVNLIGFINSFGSFSCHTSSFVETLHPGENVKIFRTKKCSTQHLPAHLANVLEKSVDLLEKKIPVIYKKYPARKLDNRLELSRSPVKLEHKDTRLITGITIHTDTLWHRWDEYAAIPNQSILKFAYCVTERTLVPTPWVEKLNTHFDALLVADEWLIDVYKNSGVTLPIFVLPEVLDLKSFLAKPTKTRRNKPFVFGFSGGFWPRKNHELLLRAFIEEFGDNPDVTLRLHGRFEGGFEKFQETFNKIKTPNVTLEHKAFSRAEYENFITSLDCYATVSKGEGFSIIPREAMAAGIPCIVSDNTAQTTICKSGCVYSVPSNIIEDSYHLKLEENFGHDFNCDIKDVRKALRDVYGHYQYYLALAQQGREWVKQYLAENLKEKYHAIVHPHTVIFGKNNEIVGDCLVTNSRTLYEKYMLLTKMREES